MGKAGKIIVFIFVAFVIMVLATVLKESGAGAVMSIGAIAIIILYQAMFKKSKPLEGENTEKDITLRK